MSFDTITIILLYALIIAQSISWFFRPSCTSVSSILLAKQIEAALIKVGIDVDPFAGIPQGATTAIQRAIAEGNRTDAIKVLRKQASLGLREAKVILDDLATYRANKSLAKCSIGFLHKQADMIISKLSIMFEPFPELSAKVLQDIKALEKRGSRVEAIKLYRIHTGVELREAKDAIDYLSYIHDQQSSCTDSLPLLHKKVDQILAHLGLHADLLPAASGDASPNSKGIRRDTD